MWRPSIDTLSILAATIFILLGGVSTEASLQSPSMKVQKQNAQGGWEDFSGNFNQADITKFGSAVMGGVDYFEWSFGSPVQRYRIKKSDVQGTAETAGEPHEGTRNMMETASDKNRDVRIKVTSGLIKEFSLQ